MSPHVDRESLAIALLAGAAGTAGSFLVAGATRAFVVAPIDGLLARSMPGLVIALAIRWFGSLGQQLNFATATAVTVGLLGLAALSGLLLGRARARPALGVAAAGGAVLLVTTAVAGNLVSGIGAAVAATAVAGAGAWGRLGRSSAGHRDRRELIGTLVGLVGVGAIADYLGRDRAAARPTGSRPATGPDPAVVMAQYDDAVAGPLAEADRQSLGVTGLEPLVSDDFYEVDINSINPTVAVEDWSLEITGAIDRPTTVTYADLIAVEPAHEFLTLRCVGEPLNGHKMDTALWTVVPIERLLGDRRPVGRCECVMLRAADDYFEEFPIAALRRGYLAYGMNGEPLPRRHGYPVRALIPGHWGEINVKWLTEIEFLDRQVDGYWERRGWHGTGPVNTTAKLHVVNHRVRESGPRIQVGGHAYAGTRGIERVEVSVDDLETWHEATLSEPLPGEDVWRQWVYEYDSPGETHSATVRAVDGTGALQAEEWSAAYPSGASGWVSQMIEP